MAFGLLFDGGGWVAMAYLVSATEGGGGDWLGLGDRLHRNVTCDLIFIRLMARKGRYHKKRVR